MGDDKDTRNRARRYSLLNVLIFLTLAYVGFLLYQAVYSNYKTNTNISDLKSEIAKVKSDQKDLGVLIAYYQTDSFRELEARKKLGMKKSGEKVITVDVPRQEKAQDDLSRGEVETDIKPNYEKWVEYIKGDLSGY